MKRALQEGPDPDSPALARASASATARSTARTNSERVSVLKLGAGRIHAARYHSGPETREQRPHPVVYRSEWAPRAP